MSDYKKDSLGTRMKTYENAYRFNLPIRMPIIIRCDGRAFYSYTRRCQKPFDQGLVNCMNETALALCEEISGCKIAYIQSDEISLLITNYDSINTQSWFDNNLQKMISISAALASVTFSMNSWKIWVPQKMDPSCDPMSECDFNKPAYFDSRSFILPKEEVNNYFVWREQDCMRNSVQMLARSLYSHKELENKNNFQLKEMCIKKGFNWDDCPTEQKHGRCVIKTKYLVDSVNPQTGEKISTERSKWVIDDNIPVFALNKQYIEKYVFHTDDKL